MSKRRTLKDELVISIANQLLAEGKKPSAKAIRERTGYGSYDTITRVLKKMAIDAEMPEEALKEFPDRLMSLIYEMNDMIQAASEQRLAADRESVEEERRGMARDRLRIEADRQAALHQLDTANASISELNKRITSTDAQLKQLSANVLQAENRATSAETKLDHATTRIAALEEQLARSVENARHADAMHKQKIEQMDGAFAAELQSKDLQIEAGHKNALTLTSRIGAAERAVERMENRAITSETAAAQTQRQLEKAQGVIADMSVAEQQQLRRNGELEAQVKAAVSAREESLAQVSKLQAQLIIAAERYETLRDRHTTESRSLILNLVDHSRKLYEMARNAEKVAPADLQEAAIAQREIEKLLGLA